MKIFTLGSGAWGLALSNVLAENGNEVFVYTRHNENKNEINNSQKTVMKFLFILVTTKTKKKLIIHTP